MIAESKATKSANQRQVFNAGDIVVKQGQPAKGFYILISGELEVIYDDVKVAEIADKGAFVGEIASLLGGKRIASIVAKTRSELLFFDNVTQYFETNPSSLLSIARTLATRIIAMDQKAVAFQKLIDKWLQAFDTADNLEDIKEIKDELKQLHSNFISQMHINN